MKKKIISTVISVSLLVGTFGVNGVSAASSSSTSVPSVQTSSKANQRSTQGVVSWSYKAFKNALRAGGWLLSQAVKPFSSKGANWIRNNSKKVADLMDKGESWTESMFAKGLKKIGAPDDVAKSLAKFIVSLMVSPYSNNA
ncbi:MAG TPA: hypothetical protein DDY49_08330, partial [Paenibacillaceae bacterium]|nr:hypothetical protein [Paenibacillaceae bacterium]